jgi:hypothetical protein
MGVQSIGIHSKEERYNYGICRDKEVYERSAEFGMVKTYSGGKLTIIVVLTLQGSQDQAVGKTTLAPPAPTPPLCLLSS